MLDMDFPIWSDRTLCPEGHCLASRSFAEGQLTKRRKFLSPMLSLFSCVLNVDVLFYESCEHVRVM